MTKKQLFILFVFLLSSTWIIFSCVDDPEQKDEEPLWKQYPAGWTWEGKHIVWLGTSIPSKGAEKGDYPSYVAMKLGAIIHNEAISGSMMRAFNYKGNWVNLHWSGARLGLTQTLKEKQFLIDYFETGLDKNGNIVANGTVGWKDLVQGVPETLTDEDKDKIRASSYEHLLINQYLDETHPDFIAFPDVIVIDHGYNDMDGHFDPDADRNRSVPENKQDRGYFIGATNYLIEEIKKYRPDQRIVFIGHFESILSSTSKAQRNLFEYWKNVYPAFELWNVLGWTQDIDPETGLTILQTNIPDKVHPSTDQRIDPETGYKLSLKLIGDACVDFLEELYP